MEKFLERIFNERTNEEITISGAQAGREKEAHSKNEITNQARKKKVYLYMTKAYDKACADAIMHVMHKEGLNR